LLPKILVDSSVILDVFTGDFTWCLYSQKTLDEYSLNHKLCINPIVYTEISTSFTSIEELEIAIKNCSLSIIEIPKEALFLAGKIFLKYKQNEGQKTSTLSDFFIGSHAIVLDVPLITRDKKIKSYFPKLKLIVPKK